MKSKRTVTVRRVSVGATGSVIFGCKGHRYFWRGRGSRLYLMFGKGRNASLVAIDHPSADDHYETARDAAAAVRRFATVG